MRILALLVLAGCAATPLQLASVDAVAGKAHLENVLVVESRVCTASYKTVLKMAREDRAAEDTRLAPYCDAEGAARRQYETALTDLLAAISAVGLGVPNSKALLDDRRARLTAAGLALGVAIQGR